MCFWRINGKNQAEKIILETNDMQELMFYIKVKELNKKLNCFKFLKDLVFEANIKIDPSRIKNATDIEKLRNYFYDAYQKRRNKGKHPPLELAVEIAKILETSVEYLVTGVNRDDLAKKMSLLKKCRELEKEIHEFNVTLGNELDLKDV
jgi:hypothetical protein